jgi:MFS family permease
MAGRLPPIGNWIFSTAGFFGIAIVASVVPVISLAFVRVLPPARPTPGPRAAATQVLGAVMKPGFAFALGGITFGAVTSFLTLYFASRGWQHGALAFTAFAVALISTRIAFGHLPDRLGGAQVASPSLLVQVLGLCLIGLADSAGLALLGAVFAGVGFSLVFPALGLEAVARVPEQSRGLAMGTYNAFFDATLGFAGPALGWIASAQGLSKVFMASAIAAACAIPFAASLKRQA